MTKSKAIEILNQRYNEYVFVQKLRFSDESDIIDRMIALLTAIDALEQDNGWISVKDRRPEPNTWIMVYIKYPLVKYYPFHSPVFEVERSINKTSDIKKVFYYGEGFYCDFGTITHWQPLPEPPESEDNAK